MCGSPWIEPVFTLAIETAMRRGELLALAPEHVKGSVAYLPDTKNGKARSVPLSTRARAALAALPQPLRRDQPYLQIDEDSLEYYWRKARKLGGCLKPDPLRLHDLRHEATSRLFEKDLEPFEVMSITGHSTTDMLKKYTHFFAHKLAAKLG